MIPRGIRNNNPGNVRYDGRTLWNGLDRPPSDGEFCRFISAAYGMRVVSKLLLAYYNFHDCRSITDYITRWAPGSDHNNTAAYIAHCCRNCDTSPVAVYDVRDEAKRAQLIMAIVSQENGQCPYSLDDAIRACRMP